MTNPDVGWEQAQSKITVAPGRVAVLEAQALPTASPYKRRFRQGAVLAPRALLFVVPQGGGPLGAGAGRLSVASRRTTLEKKPWIGVPSRHGTVERQFVLDIHLGQTVVPYRLLAPLNAVLPVRPDGILTAAQIEEHPALAAWWEGSEQVWEANKSQSDDSALLDRINFHGQLAAQLPATTHRVVYTKAGNTLASARVQGTAGTTIIDHKLYWAPISGLDEARFLTAILNSDVLLDRVRPLQALGLFGGRDFDKNVFAVPIPTYDRGADTHQELAALAALAEDAAASVTLDPEWTFQRARISVRHELTRLGLVARIEEAVGRVIPAAAIAG